LKNKIEKSFFQGEGDGPNHKLAKACSYRFAGAGQSSFDFWIDNGEKGLILGIKREIQPNNALSKEIK
jgi:hypothetical protein